MVRFTVNLRLPICYVENIFSFFWNTAEMKHASRVFSSSSNVIWWEKTVNLSYDWKSNV